MEYCGAGSVADLMRITDKMLNEEQIAVVTKDALKGLVYLHGMMKIHRDIKAGNILLNNKGEGKLADFGVSGQLSDTMAKRQTVIGTPFWMAPEVIQEVGYDVKADVWSLGITCIEMAEGKPPYSNIHPMRAIFMIPSRPPPKLTEPEKWSKELNDFIALCLTKNPEQRPSATELLKHSFVVNAKNGLVLKQLIDEAEELINKLGREEAMGMTDHDDSEGDDDVGSGTVVRGSGKIAKIGAAMGTTEYSPSSGNEGTMKIGGDVEPGYVPQFLAHRTASSNANSAASAAGNSTLPKSHHNKYTNFTVDELKKMLSTLDTKVDKEIETIRAKYAKQKKDIDSALQKKKKK